MVKNELLKDLQWRGLINDCTDLEKLDALLEEEKITLYCGFDPTAPSLHLGNLLTIIMLMRFQKFGHRPLGLVGGSTGLIGDPSGRSAERQMNSLDTVNEWVGKIKNQLSRFLDFDCGKNSAKVVNNYDWTKDLSIIDFLRDYGKNFGINYMLAKDTVASRLETGISYTEFSYMILQSMDFMHLYETENCRLQLGGSDQWGNITSGSELIRKTHGSESKVFGLTIPLLTKADGSKFGKTAGGSVWLDSKLTSPYEMYQFFINTADADVMKLLRVFTFLTEEKIQAIEKDFVENPHLRNAQKRLAEEVVTLVHGKESYLQAIKITKALFSGDIKSLNSDEIETGFKGVPTIELSEDLGLLDVLVNSKAASSKREAREFTKNNSISINGDKVNDLEFIVSKENALDGKYTVIRRGKKKYFLVKHV